MRKKKIVPVENQIKIKGDGKLYHEYIERFKKVYEFLANAPFHSTGKHYKLIKTLLDQHGTETVRAKVIIFARMCKDRSAWFTKDGPADFTLEKLSSFWNHILPPINASKAEYFIARKQEEERRVRLNQMLQR